MIILRLKEEANKYSQPKRRFLNGRRDKSQILDYSRSGIVVNGKPHFVLSVSQKTLECDEFCSLLKNYKGEIVASSELEKFPVVQDLLFDVKPYIKKAVFENFRFFIIKGNFKEESLLVYDDSFTFKEKIPFLIPFVKNLTVVTEKNADYSGWREECFSEYGLKPAVIDKASVNINSFDIIADFDKLEGEKLIVLVKGKRETVYPDYSYFQVPEELKMLEGYNIKNSVLCAAFCKK